MCTFFNFSTSNISRLAMQRAAVDIRSGSSPPQRWRPRPRTSSTAQTPLRPRAHTRGPAHGEGRPDAPRAAWPPAEPNSRCARRCSTRQQYRPSLLRPLQCARQRAFRDLPAICDRSHDEESYLTTLDRAPCRWDRWALLGNLTSGRCPTLTSCQVLRPPQPSNNGRNHFLRPCLSSARLATLVRTARCAPLRGGARETACLRVG